MSDVYRADVIIGGRNELDPVVDNVKRKLQDLGFTQEQINRKNSEIYKLVGQQLSDATIMVEKFGNTAREKIGRDVPESLGRASAAASDLQRQFARAFSVTAIEEFIRRSYMAYDSQREALTRVKLATGAYGEELDRLGQRFSILQAQTGQTLESLAKSFREFASRSGLKREEAEQLFTPIVQAADLVEVSADSMAKMVTSAIRSLHVPASEMPRVLGAWSTSLQGVGEEAARMAPRVMQAMDRVGLSGAKAAEQYGAAMSQLTVAMSSPREAATALQDLMEDLMKPGSPLGGQLRGELGAIRAGSGDLFDLLDAAANKIKERSEMYKVSNEVVLQGMRLSEGEQRLLTRWLSLSESARQKYRESTDEAANMAKRHQELETSLKGLHAAWGDLMVSFGNLQAVLGVDQALKGFADKVRQITEAIEALKKLAEEGITWGGLKQAAAKVGEANEIQTGALPGTGAVRRWLYSDRDTQRGGPSGLNRFIGSGSDYLQAFADGGVVDKPTVGIFGEAGPEAVIPLRSVEDRAAAEATLQGRADQAMWGRIHSLIMGGEAREPAGRDIQQLTPDELEAMGRGGGRGGGYGSMPGGRSMADYAAGMGRNRGYGTTGTGPGGTGTGPVGAPPVPFPEYGSGMWKTGGQTGDWTAGGLESQAGAPGVAWPFPATTAGGGGDASSGIDRSVIRAQLAANPALREQVLRAMSNEQSGNLQGMQAVAESMFNRSQAYKIPLESTSRWVPQGGYYDPGSMGRNLANPAERAKAEQALENALAGSNIANYATDNASADLAKRRLANREMGFAASYGGETFFQPGRVSGPGRLQQYAQWRAGLQATAAAQAATQTAGVGQPTVTPSQITSADLGGGVYGPIGATPGMKTPYRTAGEMYVGTQGPFKFASGGAGSGATPYGNYYVNPGTLAEGGGVGPLGAGGWGGRLPPAVAGVSSQGTSGNTVIGPGGEQRAGIEIHASSGSELDRMRSEGCFAVAADQWPAYKQALLDEAAKSPNGRLVLSYRPTPEGKAMAQLDAYVPGREDQGGRPASTVRAASRAFPEGSRVAGPAMRPGAPPLTRSPISVDDSPSERLGRRHRELPGESVERRFPKGGGGDGLDDTRKAHQELRSEMEKPIRPNIEAPTVPHAAPARRTFARQRQWNQHRNSERAAARETLGDIGPS